MPETMLFSTSIFSGFGLDFGASWASKMEPSSPFWTKKNRMGALFYFLKIDVFKNGVLEASGLDFRDPGARFLRPRGSIWEGSGTIFSIFLGRSFL